ncbi:MAG: hypothetical protein AAB840_02370, partial [Patescibacteria group bacterium]
IDLSTKSLNSGSFVFKSSNLLISGSGIKFKSMSAIREEASFKFLETWIKLIRKEEIISISEKIKDALKKTA